MNKATMPWVDPVVTHLYRYLANQGLTAEWLVYSYILAHREYRHPYEGWTLVPVRHVAKEVHVCRENVRIALKRLEELGAIKSAPVNTKLRKQRKACWYAAISQKLNGTPSDQATAEEVAFQTQRRRKRPKREDLD